MEKALFEQTTCLYRKGLFLMANSLTDQTKLSELVPHFLAYAEVELGLAAQSRSKYRDCLRQVAKILGDRPLTSYTAVDVRQLKSDMLGRSLSVGRQVSILAALKGLLSFANKEHGLPALDPLTITYPRRPRREVSFLTPAEVERFLAAIKIENSDSGVWLAGLRFRALVETLLGSAMRIGEVLSLDRDHIDLETRQARIIGKGNKQRVVFFTERALSWINKYLAARSDTYPALFATQTGDGRLGRPDIWRPFARYRVQAGITKRVTPHLLRHTAATQLLFNGCPVGHIKEILGHERLETTCRYYLGLDRRAAQQAFHRYLVYDQSALPNRESGSSPGLAEAPGYPPLNNSEPLSEYPGGLPIP
jgi:integrase/recombinase XerD